MRGAARPVCAPDERGRNLGLCSARPRLKLSPVHASLHRDGNSPCALPPESRDFPENPYAAPGAPGRGQEKAGSRRKPSPECAAPGFAWLSRSAEVPGESPATAIFILATAIIILYFGVLENPRFPVVHPHEYKELQLFRSEEAR